MRRILLISFVISFAVLFLGIIPAMGQDIKILNSTELDKLLGPIALYPDPLIAQILPASTFPDQIVQASQLMHLKGGERLIDEQDWDVSVKAVAHYPGIVDQMANNLDWSDAIGEAYINQPEDVMMSIQSLRSKAQSFGYLTSNEGQEIINEGNIVRIIPAQPEYTMCRYIIPRLFM